MSGLRSTRPKPTTRGSVSGLRPEYFPERQQRTLFVGNLDKRVSEYQLLTIFSPLGNIVRCNYLWHHTGEQRGLPRGYAFVEFENREEALKAQQAVDGKVLMGRTMAVRFAEAKDLEEMEGGSHAAKAGRKGEAGAAGGASTLKLSAEEKIRAIERKLQRMKKGGSEEKEPAPPPAASGRGQGQKRPHEEEAGKEDSAAKRRRWDMTASAKAEAEQKEKEKAPSSSAKEKEGEGRTNSG